MSNEGQEGELYRRLTYPRFSLMARKVWYDRAKQGKPTFPRPTHDEVVKEILDEAAKDFRPWWNPITEDFHGLEITYDDQLEVTYDDQLEIGVPPEEILADIEKWFKKWFGKVEKK